MEVFTLLITTPALILLLLSGIYFTVVLKGVQFTKIKDMLKLTFGKKDQTDGVSSFQAFTIALAARVGVGSLAGIALALQTGSYGAIFWMWIFALIGASNAFAESTLSAKYKEQNHDGDYVGGPAYNTKNGLGKYKLGAIYAVIIIFSYSFGYTAIQMNQISNAFYTSFGIDKQIMGIIVAFIIGLIIFGGIKSIAKVTEIFVPLMAGLFMLFSISILIINFDLVPNAFYRIFSNAFSLRSIGLGSFMSMLIVGYQRGVFSNEAGLGSGGIASASSNCEYNAEQGLVQTFGVYVTTLIICTLTALAIIVSETPINGSFGEGIVVTQHAFSVFMNNFGGTFISIALFFFATSTILSGYFYGEISLDYFNDNHILRFILRIVVIVIILLSSTISSMLIWNFVDVLIGLMAIYNIIHMFFLRKEVVEEYNKYKLKNN